MPRAAILSGTSTRQSSNAVNDVVSALSRKLTSSSPSTHIEAVQPRRSSFSMDNLLHPNKKDKKRDDSKDRDARKEKRMSLQSTKGSKTKDKNGTSTGTGNSSLRVVPTTSPKFDLVVESPPLVFIGNTTTSSGALFSGRLKLVFESPSESVKLKDFTMVLRATLHTTKPISKDCKQCADRSDVLKKWSFISEPTTYTSAKDNQFPFSYLFPGHLPATTAAHLGSLTYSLLVEATTSTGEKIEHAHALKVQRAVPPGPEKSSIRIFPPTNLTSRVQLPPVVHPIGTFPVTMTLSGVVDKRAESQTRWRLRKMVWRIEEQCKVISTPCDRHSHKVSDGKAIQHTDSKALSGDELKSGWKTDFDTIGGEILLEFEASLATRAHHKSACDMQSAAGLEVRHVLIIELIVAEEFCPNKNTSLITPTGAARVLRMQFSLPVTERAGMGISWDEEMPPMYEDVPPSPPRYVNGNADKPDDIFASAVATIEDYSGPTIVPHDLERLPTTNPDGLPYYREVDSNDINQGLPMRGRTDAGGRDEAESSNRRRYTDLRMDDLEAETAEEIYRRTRLEQTQDTNAVEEHGEGSAVDASA